MLVANWIKPVTQLLDPIYTTQVTVWYLHRQTPPEPLSALGALPFTISSSARPSAAHYRALYTRVGGPWLWWERRAYSDTQIDAQFADAERLLITPAIEGDPIGLIELEWSSDTVAEIRNFGLMPHRVGAGYGKALMAVALNHAWRAGTKEVQLNTCSLDHPRALNFYRSNGFRVINQQSGQVQIPHRHIDGDLLARIKKTGSHRTS